MPRFFWGISHDEMENSDDDFGYNQLIIYSN